jgi:hypothetical protein
MTPCVAAIQEPGMMPYTVCIESPLIPRQIRQKNVSADFTHDSSICQAKIIQLRAHNRISQPPPDRFRLRRLGGNIIQLHN